MLTMTSSLYNFSLVSLFSDCSILRNCKKRANLADTSAAATRTHNACLQLLHFKKFSVFQSLPPCYNVWEMIPFDEDLLVMFSSSLEGSRFLQHVVSGASGSHGNEHGSLPIPWLSRFSSQSAKNLGCVMAGLSASVAVPTTFTLLQTTLRRHIFHTFFSLFLDVRVICIFV